MIHESLNLFLQSEKLDLNQMGLKFKNEHRQTRIQGDPWESGRGRDVLEGRKEGGGIRKEMGRRGERR